MNYLVLSTSPSWTLGLGITQILMKSEDSMKTTFKTHYGHHEWLVMPFGITNMPTTFQRLMNQNFHQQLRKSVIVSFDGILVYSPRWLSRLQHLKIIL